MGPLLGFMTAITLDLPEACITDESCRFDLWTAIAFQCMAD